MEMRLFETSRQAGNHNESVDEISTAPSDWQYAKCLVAAEGFYLYPVHVKRVDEPLVHMATFFAHVSPRHRGDICPIRRPSFRHWIANARADRFSSTLLELAD